MFCVIGRKAFKIAFVDWIRGHSRRPTTSCLLACKQLGDHDGRNGGTGNIRIGVLFFGGIRLTLAMFSFTSVPVALTRWFKKGASCDSATQTLNREPQIRVS